MGLSSAPGGQCTGNPPVFPRALITLGEPFHDCTLATPVPSCGAPGGERPSSPHFQFILAQHKPEMMTPIGSWFLVQSKSRVPGAFKEGQRAPPTLLAWAWRLPPDDGTWAGGEQMPTQAGCAEHWHPEGRAPRCSSLVNPCMDHHRAPLGTGLTALLSQCHSPSRLLPLAGLGANHAQTQGTASPSDNPSWSRWSPGPTPRAVL